MTGVEDSPHALFRQATVFSSLRLLLFSSSTILLGIVIVGCGTVGGGVGGGGSSYNDCGVGTSCYSSCSDVCDASCSDYSPSACTDWGSTGSGTTDTGSDTGSTSGDCTDAADPSCGNYDPIGFDGGGIGDSGCDLTTCGDPGGGDPGYGGGDNWGDTGDGGDTWGDGGGDGWGDGGGDTGGGGDGGDDWGGGIARPGTGERLAPHPGHAQVASHVTAEISKLMTDRLPSPTAQNASRRRTK